ncbi:hypothetical protein Aperf_G00000098832 [Anoplocephala perfoliata]
METPVLGIGSSVTLAYPDMSPPLLETVMRLTIEKVKLQRSPPQPQSQRPTVGSEYQSQRPIPFTRAKSNSLLRTLLIIQIGRKTSRLLSVVSQAEVNQPTEQNPSVPPQPSPPCQSEKVQPKIGTKRRSSSDDEDSHGEENFTVVSEERSGSFDGPSSEKLPCLEKATPVHSAQLNSGEANPVSGVTQLSLQSTPSSNIDYNKKPCPGCQCCSIWMQQQRQEASTFQLCEPVRQC